MKKVVLVKSEVLNEKKLTDKKVSEQKIKLASNRMKSEIKSAKNNMEIFTEWK